MAPPPVIAAIVPGGPTLRRFLLAGLVLAPSMARADEAERKAVAYLAAEVPRWARENHCYSCHNNGDAARALDRARSLGLLADPAVLDDTAEWLAHPERWEKNGGDGPSSDKGLARLQFASALAAAVEEGRDGLREPLAKAAARLAEDQAADGSWPIEDGGLAGSPAAYGPRLATARAVLVLRRADPGRFARAIARGEGWLRRGKIVGTVDAAAVLMVDPGPSRAALDFLLRTQARSGGWGPHEGTPTEPFDTALALLALERSRAEPAVAAALARGRTALVAMQAPDGSWPETTRPAGGESYAQRLSTAGWATLALMASRPGKEPPRGPAEEAETRGGSGRR